MESVDEILDFAILREQEAADFYANLATTIKLDWMKEVLEGFSKEELRHKGKLLSVKKNGKLQRSESKILDLKIADYIVSTPVTDNLSYQDALIIAMQREKAAFWLYNDLAGKIDDPELKELFLGLAQEEAEHKLYFEIEYDEKILTEN
ncbi:MAG: ferritin family protein [Methylococcales bacterium]|jgi:rubrerythrin|nr:ferritin family protein [Methylococcales bacterium]MBT7445024.1 ferritin family protein [Methylococcales bacterium]